MIPSTRARKRKVHHHRRRDEDIRWIEHVLGRCDGLARNGASAVALVVIAAASG